MSDKSGCCLDFHQVDDIHKEDYDMFKRKWLLIRDTNITDAQP